MPNIPYTEQQSVQFGGPTNSDQYNKRIEQNFNDILFLYNRIQLNESIVQDEYQRFVKDQFGILRLLEDLESRMSVLEANLNTITFYNDSQVDIDRFNSTIYAIASVNRCQDDTVHGIITLPIVANSSVSKLVFVDSSGNITIPSTLSTTLIGAGADSGSATIDTSAPELAIARDVGSIWQRNVIVNQPQAGGANLTLYIQAPTDLFTTANSNCILLHPFPAFSTNIVEVAYTTNPNPVMADSDGYNDFPPYYSGVSSSIGWTPPGAWTDDQDNNAGFRAYYFDPQPITGLRLRLNQSGYFFDTGQYVYSYGASLIDLRYNKFLSTGQTIIRFDAPSGGVINDVTGVEPQIYNVDPAIIPNVFSFQAIYETAYNSGIYTTTPVSNSSRVWILVTLSATSNGGTPALSGLTITYS